MKKKTSSLVNERRVFDVVKRLFIGSSSEILSELLQNSQRAGADTLRITTGPQTISIIDNGKGIQDGLEGFRRLLSIADSHYSETVEKDQAPMGVGFYSLLSNAEVFSVQVASGGLKLKIDTKRWFNSEIYRGQWQSLVQPSDTGIGTTIIVGCTDSLVKAFISQKPHVKREWPVVKISSDEFSPFTGYAGVLRVFFDGEELDTNMPEGMKLVDPILLTYEGNTLRVGFDRASRTCANRSENLYVNWFGQQIGAELPFRDIYFDLEVRQGNPLTPRSPTRKGLVQDQKLEKLEQFLRSWLLSFFRGLVEPDLRVLATAFGNFPELKKELPWIIATRLTPRAGCDSESQFEVQDEEVIKKADNPLILDTQILVKIEENWVEHNGLDLFLKHLNVPAYEMVSGDAEIKFLYWIPGERTIEHPEVDIRETGMFGIGYEEVEPSGWIPATFDIRAFANYTTYGIEYAKVILGTRDAIKLLNEACDVVFEYSSDADDGYEHCRDIFDDSIAEVVRDILGNVIPYNFSRYDLTSFVPEGDRIETIGLVYEKEVLKGIRLYLKNGSPLELGLY